MPNLAPFYLFYKVKSAPKGTRFEFVEAVKEKAARVLELTGKDFQHVGVVGIEEGCILEVIINKSVCQKKMFYNISLVINLIAIPRIHMTHLHLVYLNSDSEVPLSNV